MKIIGNKIYDVCADCGDIVQINKFIVGSLHVCAKPKKEISDHVLLARKKALEEAE